MKSPYVGSLVPNEVATVQLLVLAKEIRQKKTGEPYLTMHLADRTGEIEAKMWDNVADVLDAFQRDDFIKVKGLVSREDAKAAAKTIATSMLVKTALFGEDANWGRILAAAGRAGVSFDPRRAAIQIGDVTIVKDGAPIGGEAEKRANEILKQQSYTIELSLGDGPGEFRYLTCDLGHGYVDVNAGYRS